ncbi:RNA-binding protein 1-like isoform X2 [Quercus robur]|uniref:RNA-binding protein 1-like isoform X2 n=1 Tax=Quercus robur TaxID=38942 RepID=UPI002161434A|nr:RNA-binding protein 1-like isoform X2 [Quercus robur]
MADPYSRYGAGMADRDRDRDRASVSRPSFPGYLSSEPPSLALASTDMHPSSSDFLNKDINSLQPGAYGFDAIAATAAAAAGPSIKGFPSPLNDPTQRQDLTSGITQTIRDVSNERPTSLRNLDGVAVPGRESNVLFVDKLPNDCTRREVGHLFRPFIGYKDIKVVHKEPRRSGDKAMVLCFVEFVDSNCALTAMEALQGYKFDDKKPDAPVLTIQFAHFPFKLPDHDEQQNGVPR